jgi:hypothetical protein
VKGYYFQKKSWLGGANSSFVFANKSIAQSQDTEKNLKYYLTHFEKAGIIFNIDVSNGQFSKTKEERKISLWLLTASTKFCVFQ